MFEFCKKEGKEEYYGAHRPQELNDLIDGFQEKSKGNNREKPNDIQ